MNAILLSLMLANPAAPDGAEGRSTLAQAMFERRSNRLERALTLLDRAEQQLTSSRLLGEIHAQRALIYSALDRPQRAVQNFIRAMTIDPDRVHAEPRGKRTPRAIEARTCARRLLNSGRSSAAWRAADATRAWSCPVPDVPASVTTAVKPSASPPSQKDRLNDEALPSSLDGSAVRASNLIRTAAEERVDGHAGPPVPTYIFGGVAIASLGTGIALGAIAADQATDAEPDADGKGTATAANVTFAVAGTAAAAALLWWILD